MRTQSRRAAVVATIALAAGAAGCGGGDAPTEVPRLTAEDVDLLVRHQGDARRLLALDPDDPSTARRAAEVGKATCRRVATAGPVLRLTAPTCRASVAAAAALTRAGAAADRCGTDDDACHRRTLVAYVDAFEPLATATEDTRHALAPARLSRRCLDVVAGPPRLAAAERAAGAAVAEHGRLGRAMYAAVSHPRPLDRAYRTFTTQLRDVERAFAAYEREGRRHAELPAEDCRGDVARR